MTLEVDHRIPLAMGRALLIGSGVPSKPFAPVPVSPVSFASVDINLVVIVSEDLSKNKSADFNSARALFALLNAATLDESRVEPTLYTANSLPTNHGYAIGQTVTDTALPVLTGQGIDFIDQNKDSDVLIADNGASIVPASNGDGSTAMSRRRNSNATTITPYLS